MKTELRLGGALVLEYRLESGAETERSTRPQAFGTQRVPRRTWSLESFAFSLLLPTLRSASWRRGILATV